MTEKSVDAAPKAWMHRRRDGKRPADLHPWFLAWHEPSPPPAPYWHEVVALVAAHPEVNQRELVALADHMKHLFSGRCDHCGSREVCWVGHSKRVGNPTWRNSDVEQCQDCGRAWYYARTGRRITIRAYRVWQPVAVS